MLYDHARMIIYRIVDIAIKPLSASPSDKPRTQQAIEN